MGDKDTVQTDKNKKRWYLLPVLIFLGILTVGAGTYLYLRYSFIMSMGSPAVFKQKSSSGSGSAYWFTAGFQDRYTRLYVKDTHYADYKYIGADWDGNGGLRGYVWSKDGTVVAMRCWIGNILTDDVYSCAYDFNTQRVYSLGAMGVKDAWKATKTDWMALSGQIGELIDARGGPVEIPTLDAPYKRASLLEWKVFDEAAK